MHDVDDEWCQTGVVEVCRFGNTRKQQGKGSLLSSIEATLAVEGSRKAGRKKEEQLRNF